MGNGLANEGLLESWRLSLHDKSPRTIDLYLRCARWFAEWLTANGRPEDHPGDLAAVSRRDVEAWFSSQREAGLQGTTLRSRWIALRSLYKWAHEEEEVPDNPMARVRVEKTAPGPVAVLSTDDLLALLKACGGKEFIDRRDYAIVRLLTATGMRLSECGNLTLPDVDLSKRIIFIAHGKGDRARFVRIDAGTAAALDRYKRARSRHRQAGLAALWLARDGKLRHTSIPLMLERRANLAGLAHVHAHMFRHSFADRFLTNGGTEGDLQRLGGWESADVMRRYGAVRATDRALAAYDTVDPMAGL